MDTWYTLQDLPATARRLIERYGKETVYALSGDLGSGKTTLVVEMCRQLGVADGVSSPSYGIVNEYGAPGAKTVHHLDCYRLNDVTEAIDAGIEDLLERADGTVFIEWPAVIEPLLPPGVVFLHLTHDPQGGGRRHLRVNE